MTNYFEPDTLKGEDRPRTSKEEDVFSHGFGMRSMEYVAEKYGGLMRLETEDRLFLLNLCIPVGEKDAAEEKD